jgi:hypothetical protein
MMSRVKIPVAKAGHRNVSLMSMLAGVELLIRVGLALWDGF